VAGKSDRCVGMTNYHLHVPSVLKSGSFNLRETSARVVACNGIALFLAAELQWDFNISRGTAEIFFKPDLPLKIQFFFRVLLILTKYI
jgi:hypothetical protein